VKDALRIDDAELRERFLTNVRENARIVSLASEWSVT
jgi:hypothetical protein